MKKLMLGIAAAIGIAGAADAWTCITPVAGYKVTASMVPGAHNAQSLRVAVATDDGKVAAMKLHAWFIDEDGLILGEAPLSQPQANGVTLVGTSEDVQVPARAASMVVIGQPTEGGKTRAVATQFRIPGGA